LSLAEFTFGIFKQQTMNQLQPATKQYSLFDDGGLYIDASRLFFAYFHQIPNIKILRQIDAARLRKWVEKEEVQKILCKHCRQEYNRETRSMKHTEAYYILGNHLLLHIEAGELSILHTNEQDEIAEEFLMRCRKFTKRDRINQDIGVVVNGHRGLRTVSLNMKKPAINFSMHYNSELQKEHINILNALKQNSKSGLHLFYGLPGTGKSTYIRYLIRNTKKKAIFIPPRLAGNFDSPELTELLINNEKSIFIIEDAEELIITRESGRNSSISMLLNLTDGILGESLGIQVIATFNTDLHNIDKALLRKGRLLSLFEFKPLQLEKARELATGLGHDQEKVKQDMTLAELYNLSTGEQTTVLQPKRTPIGFNRTV
jgi:SpoVK/Ycf46/Vps4 family AAA+-type ATPase